MIPQTPSLLVPPDSSAQLLLQQGKPFVEFPRFSILDLNRDRDYDGNPIPFSEWLTKRLHLGQPFVIQDFKELEDWPKVDTRDGNQPGFGIERLIELSTKKNIPIRNCSTGRDLSFTLRKFADSARQNYQEFQNFYARDLQCPQEWQEQCRKILPTEVQWGGRLDLFQWLPPCARSEVMMAYVGSEGSASGFHRCFSSTVALNLLVESDDRPVVCFGTDFDSQKRYDAFMSAKGVSPHLDWVNLSTDELQEANFPLYVYDQKVGDLVVFPPATAHQIWNPSNLCTKLVWNILHPLSLEVGFQYVQPPFNRLCHPDVARTSLSLASAMLSLVKEHQTSSTPIDLPPDLPLLSRLFRQMVHDESIDSTPVTAISSVQLPAGTIATCNFCSTAIWNRHVRCTQCTDFDLCLSCYLNGRSCDHLASYAWAELVPQETCARVLNRAREILGFQPEESRIPDRHKTLGTAVNDLMRSKASSTSRLCHLCRIDHPEWKGRRCDKCTAFFCYRGLYRHFDSQPADVLRQSGLSTCPKCQEICNCRCCHFTTAYQKSEKPASKRRVKPSDNRGKITGFADNVFDQKRGRRESASGNQSQAPLPGVAQIAGKKRPALAPIEAGPATPLRKMEIPTPEPDFGSLTRSIMFIGSREGSDSTFASINGQMQQPLPSMKTLDMLNASDLETSPTSIAGGTGSLGRQRENTLPPMLNHIMPQANSKGTPSALAPSLSVSTLRSAMQDDVKTPSPHLPSPLDEAITKLETQIAALRRYEEEFKMLDLEDSRKMLAQQLQDLEVQLKVKKKEKGALLMERLQREGFGLLAARVGKEVGLGLE